jgi:glycosyltransferase involved in cell wall biosynthesis
MRVAIIHYWLVNWRGGEKVLKAIADLYPQADIFAHVVSQELVDRELPGRNIATTFISRLPMARRYYQRYLPLMPLALEQLDLRSYDLVISSESGPAKGVIVAPNATHVCYCHSPMRYVWDMYHEYTSRSGTASKMLMAPLLHYVRQWDQLSSQRVDSYVANSHFVAQRIAKYYRRTSSVIYPPVAVQDFVVSHDSEDYYLSVGQLVAYKRPELLVEAFNILGKRLVIIGDGSMLKSLRKMAKPNIQILGRQTFEVIRHHYSKCRALVFPGIEDFGMVPVEAMASGKSVIAFGAGGALETIVEGKTGTFFREQNAASLVRAVRDFEASAPLDPVVIRNHALRYSEERFSAQFKELVRKLLAGEISRL